MASNPLSEAFSAWLVPEARGQRFGWPGLFLLYTTHCGSEMPCNDNLIFYSKISTICVVLAHLKWEFCGLDCWVGLLKVKKMYQKYLHTHVYTSPLRPIALYEIWGNPALRSQRAIRVNPKFASREESCLYLLHFFFCPRGDLSFEEIIHGNWKMGVWG